MLTILVATLLGSAAPNPVEPHIISASLFKNGFAVVSREFEVSAPGTYQVEKIPEGSMGTLWFTASEGTKLEDVATTNVDTKSKYNVPDIEGILVANVGQQVRVGIRNGDKITGLAQEGKLVAVGKDYVLVQGPSSSIAIPKDQVSSLASLSGQLLYQAELTSSKRVLNIRTSGKPGRVHMISLERGLTWSPAYSIDISDPGKLTIVGKATVLDDLEDLAGVEARFVTGFPNVPFSVYLDPLIRGGTVGDFTSMLEGIGDPNAVTMNRRPMPGGGFGGQGGARMTENNSRVNFQDLASSMDVAPMLGSQQEDLFFYKQPNVTTKKGDRSYHILFSATAPYEDVYTWDLPDGTVNNIEYTGVPDGALDVWHTLRFRNTSGLPFTTAVATTFKGGEVLGQDAMRYVSAGSLAEVKITKALDVHAEADEAEVSRERGAIKNSPNYPVFDLVLLQGTLRVTNTKSVAVRLRIKKELTGDITGVSGNPVVTKTAKGLRSMNPGAKIEWNTDIDPGKSLTLSYSYKLYVRSQQ